MRAIERLKNSQVVRILNAKLGYIRPINWSFIIFLAFGLVVWIGFNPPPAMATGILDTMLGTMQTASASWMTKALSYANTLFFGLTGLEFTWFAIQQTIKKNDVSDIAVATMMKVISITLMLLVINQVPVWLPKVISSFTQAGTAISGGSGTTITPSTLINDGVDFASQLIQAGITPSGSGLTSYVFSAMMMGLTGIAIVIAFVAIATQLFMTLMESYLIMGGGALMLGFLGSRWTSNWGEKYFGYVVSIGIKLFVIYLIIGFGETMINMLKTTLTGLTAAGKTPGVGDYLGMFGASGAYGVAAWMTPSLAGSMMNGSPNMTAANAGAAGAAMAAAPVAAALSVGASGAQAAGLAGKGFGSTKAAAAGGIGGSPASGGGFAGGITGGTGALSRLTQNTGKAPGGATSAMGGGAATSKGTQAAAGAIGKGASAGIEAAGKMAGGNSKESGGAALKGGNDAGSGNTSGNGFANSTGGGEKNATGGMSASEGGANSAQQNFEADQKGGDKKSISDKLFDKSKDLQQAADRKKPNLPHDGAHGGGLSIRLTNPE